MSSYIRREDKKMGFWKNDGHNDTKNDELPSLAIHTWY